MINEKISSYPKVLLACPIHDVKRYVLDEWLNFVSTLTYPNYSIYLSDNSPTDKLKKELVERGFNVDWNNPKDKNNYEAMCDSHNDCRDKVLNDNSIEYLLHLECDVFPQTKDFIEQLLLHKKPIVGAIYHIGDGPNKCKILAQNFTVDKYGIESYNINSATDILFADGSLKQVFSAGIGCTLIHRSVLEKIKFRVEKNEKKHPDSWFCLDLLQKKIPYFVDTSIMCTHKNSNWGEILR